MSDHSRYLLEMLAILWLLSLVIAGGIWLIALVLASLVPTIGVGATAAIVLVPLGFVLRAAVASLDGDRNL